MNLIKAKVAPLGLEPSLLDRLKDARWIESPGYPVAACGRKPSRPGAARRAGSAAAADCDLFMLVVDGWQPGPCERRRIRPGLGPLVPGAPPARGCPRAWSWSPASIGPNSAAAGSHGPDGTTSASSFASR